MITTRSTWIRPLAVATALALLGTSVAACSSSGTGTTTATGAATGTSASPGSSSSSSSGSESVNTSPATGKTSITWWAWNPDNTQDAMWINAFEKDHPDITVKFRFIQYGDYVNAVRLAATSSSGPDVFGLQVGSLTQQFAPLAADLGPLADKNIGSDWKSQIADTDQLAAGGKQVGLPWMITGGGLLWYNKTILDKAGVTPPKTLAEWVADCPKIKALGVKCFVQGAKDDWVNLDVYQTIANQIAPGEIYKALDGKSSFDSPTFVKAFDAWKQLFTDGIIQPGALGTSTYPDANDMFNKGQAAMIALGTWNNSQMTTAALKAGVSTYGPSITKQVFVPVAFPAVVANPQETGRLFGGPDTGWAVSAHSAHQEAAFTFVQWLTTSKIAQTMMADTLQTPALKAVPVPSTGLADPAVQKPALTDQASQLGNLIGARQIQNADVQTALGQALS